MAFHGLSLIAIEILEILSGQAWDVLMVYRDHGIFLYNYPYGGLFQRQADAVQLRRKYPINERFPWGREVIFRRSCLQAIGGTVIQQSDDQTQRIDKILLGNMIYQRTGDLHYLGRKAPDVTGYSSHLSLGDSSAATFVELQVSLIVFPPFSLSSTYVGKRKKHDSVWTKHMFQTSVSLVISIVDCSLICALQSQPWCFGIPKFWYKTMSRLSHIN